MLSRANAKTCRSQPMDSCYFLQQQIHRASTGTSVKIGSCKKDGHVENMRQKETSRPAFLDLSPVFTFQGACEGHRGWAKNYADHLNKQD